MRQRNPTGPDAATRDTGAWRALVRSAVSATSLLSLPTFRSPNARRCVALALAAGFTLPALANEPPAATTPSRTVLVLDASGSMWGQIEGRSKIAIARDVIGELLEGWRSEDALGLTAYGHRRRGDCADIEQLVPLATDNGRQMLDAVATITPKGKTPIGASVTRAAEELEYRSAPATVVLVSDGRETCDADPCEIAAALARDGLDFTAHVIGFDVTEDEHAGLACIASETGGIFVAARDAGELREAVQRALQTATKTQTPGLWLGAALAAERDLVRDDVTWRIVRVAPDGRDGVLVHEGSSPTLFLTPGTATYRAIAEFQGVQGFAQFDYEAGTSARHVIGLGASRLQVSAGRGPYDAAPTSPVRFEVTDVRGSRERVAVSDRPRDTFVLPAGRYRVTVEHEGTTQVREVELRAGQEMRERFRFGSGRLALRAVLAPGSPPIEQPLHWEIRRAPQDGRVEREPVASRDKATLLLSLDAGRYQVTVQFGDTEVRELVDLSPGALSTHTIPLHAGTARVFASLPPPGGPIQDDVAWRVYALGEGASGRPIAERTSAGHNFVLPVGTYRVDGELGDRSGSQVVEVEPGGATALGVVLH